MLSQLSHVDMDGWSHSDIAIVKIQMFENSCSMCNDKGMEIFTLSK